VFITNNDKIVRIVKVQVYVNMENDDNIVRIVRVQVYVNMIYDGLHVKFVDLGFVLLVISLHI